MKKLLLVIAILLLAVSCVVYIYDKPTDEEPPHPQYKPAELGKRDGFYRSDNGKGNLMLEIFKAGDVDFSNTGDIADMQRVITGEAESRETSFDLTYVNIDGSEISYTLLMPYEVEDFVEVAEKNITRFRSTTTRLDTRLEDTYKNREAITLDIR